MVKKINEWMDRELNNPLDFFVTLSAFHSISIKSAHNLPAAYANTVNIMSSDFLG